MNNSTATSPPVSTRFLGLMVAGLTIAAVVIVIIVAIVDKNTTNAGSIVSAALSPVSGIFGLVIGHHVGSRRP